MLADRGYRADWTRESDGQYATEKQAQFANLLQRVASVGP